MNLLKLVASIVLSLSVYSAVADEVVYTCESTLKFFGDEEGQVKTIKNVVEIFKSVDGSLYSYITQDGFQISEKMSVVVIEENINADLPTSMQEFEEADLSLLNQSEKTLALASLFQNDPIFEGLMTTGIEKLSDVKSAKLYLIGETSRFGTASVVLAKDAVGNDMGSFFGGSLLLGACE